MQQGEQRRSCKRGEGLVDNRMFSIAQLAVSLLSSLGRVPSCIAQRMGLAVFLCLTCVESGRSGRVCECACDHGDEVWIW